MESDLFKQLEDKKKEVYNSDIWKEIVDAGIEEEIEIEYKKVLNVKVGSKEYNELDDETKAILISIKKAEIAILEQAIAEMQKQRQDFIDIINSLGEIRGKSNDLQCIKLGESFSTNSVEWLKKELLKQLNQPKEEGKE